ncbi:MAG: Mll5128 protein, partial [uncultured Thermoleophilia bacterium]
DRAGRSATGAGDREHLDPDARRLPARRADLAARGRRGAARAGGPRVHPLPEDGRHGGRRLDAPPVRRRAWLRRRAGRPPRERRLGRHPPRRVPAAGAGRRRGGHRMARGPVVVHGRGRDDRHLVGRLQRPPGRGAPSTGPEGDRHALLDRRPVRGRRPLHGRLRARLRDDRLGVDDARLQQPGARPDGRGRALAFDVARPPGADAAVPAHVARPPASGRLLEAGLRVRGLRGDRVRGLRRRRLGRRVPERHPAPARGIAGERAAEGARRPVVAQLPGGRDPGADDRLPPGDRPVVGPLAEGRGHRDHGRAGPAGLDARARRARAVPRRAARTLGGRGGLAVTARRAADVRARAGRHAGGRARRGPAADVRGRPGGGRRRRHVVPLRPDHGHATGPARRGWPGAQLHVGAARRAVRAARVPGARPDRRRGPSRRLRGRAPVRRRAGRRLAARLPRRPQPDAPDRARAAGAARARPPRDGPDPPRVHRARVPARAPRAGGTLADLLAVDLAVAGAGHPPAVRRHARAPGASRPPGGRRAAAVRGLGVRAPARDGDDARGRERTRDPPERRVGPARADVDRGLRPGADAPRRPRVGDMWPGRVHDSRRRPALGVDQLGLDGRPGSRTVADPGRDAQHDDRRPRELPGHERRRRLRGCHARLREGLGHVHPAGPRL